MTQPAPTEPKSNTPNKNKDIQNESKALQIMQQNLSVIVFFLRLDAALILLMMADPSQLLPQLGKTIGVVPAIGYLCRLIGKTHQSVDL